MALVSRGLGGGPGELTVELGYVNTGLESLLDSGNEKGGKYDGIWVLFRIDWPF